MDHKDPDGRRKAVTAWAQTLAGVATAVTALITLVRVFTTL